MRSPAADPVGQNREIAVAASNGEGVTEARFTPEMGAAEARRVWDLYQAGAIRELYFRADKAMAVLVLECADVAEADAVLTSLPLVAAGLIEFEVLPLRAYPGFARLFEPTSS